MDWQQIKRNSDSELNDFFLSTVPAQYFRPNDSKNGDDSTKNCLATNVIITSPGRCALTQRLMNNVYSFYRETSYPLFNCDKKWDNILHELLFFLHVANLGRERLLGKLSSKV